MTTWKRNLVVVWISQFLSIAGFSLVLPFAPYYIQELGVTNPDAVKWWAGISQTVVALSLAVSAPIWGALADRYGRKLMMLRANFAAAIVLTLMGFAPSVQIFILLRCLQGSLTGTMNAAMTLVAAYTPKKQQGMALGTLSAAVFSGAMAGPLIGGVLADWIGYRYTFLLSGALLLASTFLVLFQVREEFVRPARTESVGRITWRDRFRALGPGAPILLLIAWTSLARRIDQPMFPLFVQELLGRLKGAPTWMGIVNGCAAFAAMLAGPLLGRLVDRISPPRLARWSTVLGGLFMALTGCVTSVFQLIPIRYMMAFCVAGLDPVFHVWLSRSTPEAQRGRIFGWAVTARGIGWAISPLLAAAIGVRFGLRAVFFIGPILFLALIPIINYVSRQVVEHETDDEP